MTPESSIYFFQTWDISAKLNGKFDFSSIFELFWRTLCFDRPAYTTSIMPLTVSFSIQASPGFWKWKTLILCKHSDEIVEKASFLCANSGANSLRRCGHRNDIAGLLHLFFFFQVLFIAQLVARGSKTTLRNSIFSTFLKLHNHFHFKEIWTGKI